MINSGRLGRLYFIKSQLFSYLLTIHKYWFYQKTIFNDYDVTGEEELDDEYKPQEMDAVTEADGKSVRFDLPAPSESMALDSDINRIDEDELQKFRDARSHENFPDEVDTPREKLARERFV